MMGLSGQRRRPHAPYFRVRVERRRCHGAFDQLDMGVTGRRWSWWCSCDRDPSYATSQQVALRLALAHLANTHGELPRQRRAPW